MQFSILLANGNWMKSLTQSSDFSSIHWGLEATVSFTSSNSRRRLQKPQFPWRIDETGGQLSQIAHLVAMRPPTKTVPKLTDSLEMKRNESERLLIRSDVSLRCQGFTHQLQLLHSSALFLSSSLQ